MTAAWVKDEIASFGLLLELSSFALDDRGLAAVRFENGVTLRLELSDTDLWVQTLFALPADDGAVGRLLAEAQPERNRVRQGAESPCVRAAYLDRSGEALLAAKLPRDRIEAAAIDTVFRDLFERAVRLGRAS